MNGLQIIVGIILYGLFFMMCYLATGSDKKNLGGFRTYPDEVQKRVYQDEVLGKLAPKEISTPITLLSNMMMFTVVFSVLGIALKEALCLGEFGATFLYFLILGEGLNLFDFVVIDLLWWRNAERIRFSCVPEKEMYQDPKKHIESFVRGIPVFALSALVAAWVVMIFS